MTTTASNLIRWTGLSALVGGSLFVAIQPFHPPESLASVTTTALAGFLLLEVMWALTAAFQFAEGLILPLLATDAPQFVVGFLGITSGSPSEVSLGILPVLYSLTSVLYLIGGVLLGIATFRAGILPRWAGGALAFATVSPLGLSLLLPHEFVRLAAVPFGLALAGLGYALWSERRGSSSQPVPARARAELRQAGAE